MAVNSGSRAEVPGFVGIMTSILRRLLRAGVPMGPSALLSVRGRKSGIERTTPVMLIEVGGRRWIQGTFGESNWVRNLRETGEATLRVRGRAVNVTAVELSTEEAESFFRDVLGPYVRRIPFGRQLMAAMVKSNVILDDPRAAAERHPVFELHPALERRAPVPVAEV
jgi:deazaflavin-dependent oxidoreductase (nitroreductase family)